MSNETLFFGSFAVFIIIMLALDLGVFNKKDEVVSLKKAGLMSAIWVSVALAFYFFLRYEGQLLHSVDTFRQLEAIVNAHKHNIQLIPGNYEASLDIYKKNLSLEYITGYVIEYALSVDNIFVMVLIFSAFAVKEKYYHRVLFWGILGAIVMRFLFIFIGAALISKFAWILYVFGVFLIYSGVMMFVEKDGDDNIDTQNHKVVKFASRLFPVYPTYVGHNFFHKENGKRYITPLFIVLLIIEFTDVVFAADSIPAIFAVTKDPYLVFFSNIFAILGLRSMFFLLVNFIHKFHYLKTGLAVLLVFIGVKMLGHEYLKEWGFTTAHSLYVIIGILVISVVTSLVFPKKEIKAS